MMIRHKTSSSVAQFLPVALLIGLTFGFRRFCRVVVSLCTRSEKEWPRSPYPCEQDTLEEVRRILVWAVSLLHSNQAPPVPTLPLSLCEFRQTASIDWSSIASTSDGGSSRSRYVTDPITLIAHHRR